MGPPVSTNSPYHIADGEEASAAGQRMFDVAKDMEYTEAALLVCVAYVSLVNACVVRVQETLRLHPSVPGDVKSCVEDDVLPDGTHVRKGDLVRTCLLLGSSVPCCSDLLCALHVRSRFQALAKPNQGLFAADLASSDAFLLAVRSRAFPNQPQTVTIQISDLQRRPTVCFLPRAASQSHTGCASGGAWRCKRPK